MEDDQDHDGYEDAGKLGVFQRCSSVFCVAAAASETRSAGNMRGAGIMHADVHAPEHVHAGHPHTYARARTNARMHAARTTTQRCAQHFRAYARIHAHTSTHRARSNTFALTPASLNCASLRTTKRGRAIRRRRARATEWSGTHVRACICMTAQTSGPTRAFPTEFTPVSSSPRHASLLIIWHPSRFHLVPCHGRGDAEEGLVFLSSRGVPSFLSVAAAGAIAGGRQSPEPGRLRPLQPATEPSRRPWPAFTTAPRGGARAAARTRSGAAALLPVAFARPASSGRLRRRAAASSHQSAARPRPDAQRGCSVQLGGREGGHTEPVLSGAFCQGCARPVSRALRHGAGLRRAASVFCVTHAHAHAHAYARACTPPHTRPAAVHVACAARSTQWPHVSRTIPCCTRRGLARIN